MNSSDLIEGDGKRLGGGLDMVRRFVPLHRAPFEDGGFLRVPRLGVVDLKR
jgi:hypothetical protein